MDNYYMMNQSGEKSSDFFLYFEEYPTIQHGQERIKEEQIPGRGNVHIRTGTYSDTKISLLLDLSLPRTQNIWMDVYTNARNYLKGMKTVSFCDDPDVFYRVCSVDIESADRYAEEAGDFGVTLLCQPGMYITSGTEEILLSNFNGINKYFICHPVYKISGEGTCKLNVNGKTVSINVAQTMVIDTDRMIAYKEDSGAIMNTSIIGNYEDLYLQNGANTISATYGFRVSIIPNWRKL